MINITVNKRGKLLKDITKIRNITKDIISSYGVNPKSEFLRDASMDIIRASRGNVNTKSDGGPGTNDAPLDAGQEAKRFSLRTPVEQAGDLIAVHNLGVGELLKSLRLGCPCRLLL